ncbi:type II toxin-antitoxin system RelE/ParE family toxin [Mucilaginibacter terrigena]|uniref:Type II toxin-antitoxin system RelE/ParE family toxin n=1 Tax=Mucilaginibacter terrigena TaxID=2492395 RepID=A0A4Q5LHV0_9SPHI|nr:type II toxin-antitoxin system RelE/ParE family toxin [Mucilaginibacter terrigena]RYU87268.1 type II toxin-antitoxin system RelE/ParE family toxin [Mucilaginibacter terrigena]
MAFKIIWTRQAANGFDKIVRYLAANWTDREVTNFINEAENFFEVLSKHPEILQRSGKKNNAYRGPINPLTIVTYRLKPLKKQIELINIRSARQKPSKHYPAM